MHGTRSSHSGHSIALYFQGIKVSPKGEVEDPSREEAFSWGEFFFFTIWE